MACEWRGSEDRDPAAADRMTALERNSRRLLRVYPAAYRRDRGDEIIGTLLDTTTAGRSWPRFCDVRALLAGGVKARAAQNRQRSAGANLRAAVMVGITLYFSFWISTYLVNVIVTGWSSWPAALCGLFIVATVVVAWTGSRIGVLAAALAGSAVIVAFGFGAAPWLGVRLVELLGLIGLAVLTRSAARPSWRWLWLPGLIIAPSVLVESVGAFMWLSYGLSRFALIGFAAIAVGALAWFAIDARLMVAFLTFLAAIGIQTGAGEFPPALSSLPFLLVIASLLAPSVWMLRRQSASPVRAA
jgi:hypothetical protein